MTPAVFLEGVGSDTTWYIYMVIYIVCNSSSLLTEAPSYALVIQNNIIVFLV